MDRSSESTSTEQEIYQRSESPAPFKTVDDDTPLGKVLKKYKAVARNFQRQGGVHYVRNEHWIQCYPYTLDCHVYVGTASPPGTTEAGRHVDPTRGVLPSLPSIKPPERSARTTLPDRIGIRNEIVMSHLSEMAGINEMNHDHVPPFRSIVPYEQQIRSLLEQKENEFAVLAARRPDDPAVTRDYPWLPLEFTYLGTIGTYSDGTHHTLEDGTSILSTLDTARILLDGLRALVFVLDHDLADLVQTHRESTRGTVQRIPFSHLWHLFRPGQEIVTKQPEYQVYRVVQVSGGRKSVVPRKERRLNRNTVSNLVIDCFHLDYDREQIRPVPETLYIRPYEGDLPVTSLNVYPLDYDRGPARSLRERGKKFVELVRVSHRRYKGISLAEGDSSNYEEIDSDVIIDFESAYRSGQIERRPDYGGGVIMSPTEEDTEETQGESWNYDDEQLRANYRAEFFHRTPLLEDILLDDLDDLDDERLILLPYRVYGYVLRSRKWFPLNIEKISEISSINVGDPDAFDSLVLPPEHRDIVRALVKTHARTKRSLGSQPPVPTVQREFDIVQGKGKGLIILLHGAPGVGKTSTAECVAAHTGRPLFPITCGDLGGTSAQEVEENLERFFDLARRWGCVLLLDEADVFLGERIQGNIAQNSLVSVFLRVLEYYSGILILTTNRVGQFDEAAISRIHCALYYPTFDEERTMEVWKKNIERLQRQNETSDQPVKFNGDKIIRFAQRQWSKGARWNGRQIKNAFQTAVALAEWDTIKYEKDTTKPATPKLKTDHFRVVTEASLHFEQYLTQVRRSDQQRARDRALRRDDLGGGKSNPAPNERVTSSKKKVIDLWNSESEEQDEAEDSVGFVRSQDSSGSESEIPVKKSTKKAKHKSKREKDKVKEKEIAKEKPDRKGKDKKRKPREQPKPEVVQPSGSSESDSDSETESE